MQALMVVMACAATPTAVHTTPQSAAAAIAPELRTGALLMSDGKCLAVKLFSRSAYTHVATIVREHDGLYVYDSQNDIGVRRLSLADYLAKTAGDEIEVLNPGQRFGKRRAERYREYLQSQLGRPYDIMHHLTGTRSEGLHCAEYLTDSLIAANVITAEQPSRVSPASLRSGLLTNDLYERSVTLVVRFPEPERPAGDNWCHELWRDTTDCCETCWSGFRGCVLCR